MQKTLKAVREVPRGIVRKFGLPEPNNPNIKKPIQAVSREFKVFGENGSD